jgi:hypothetical protein
MNTTHSLHTFKIFPKYHHPRNLHLPRKHKLVFPTEPLLTITTKAFNLFINKTTIPHILTEQNPRPDGFFINNYNAQPTNKYYLFKIINGKTDTINEILNTAKKLADHTSFEFYTDSPNRSTNIFMPHGIWLD